MKLRGLIVRDTASTVLAWVIVVTAMCGATLGSYQSSFSDPAARQIAVTQASHNPSTLFLYGTLPAPGYAAQVFCWEMGAWVSLVVATAGVLLASRLARGWESEGRLELIRSTGTHPSSFLWQVQVWLVSLALVLGSVAALSIGIQSHVPGNSWPAAASFGGVIAISFLLPAIATSVCAQITPSISACRGAGLLVVMAAFLLRATGDIHYEHWMSTVSFLGLRSSVRPFTDNDGRPFLWWVMAVIGLSVVAFALQNRREYGTGLIPDRQESQRRLHARNMWGLAARLNASTSVICFTAVAILSVFMTGMGAGAVAQARSHTLHGGLLATQLAGTDPAVAYLRYGGILTAILTSATGVVLIHRASDDEMSGRIETILTTGERHWKPLSAQALTVAIASLITTILTSIITAIVATHTIDHSDGLTKAAWFAVLGQWPAVLLLVMLTTLVAGLTPRRGWIPWCIWGASAGITLFGQALRVPTWMINLSPLHHAPSHWAWVELWPSLVLLILSAAAHGLAILFQSRRDIRPS